MVESMTVTVGLDVHARSVRLAAVRADALLEGRTLAYDVEAVARALGRWPSVRCCYEAGPTGFGLYRFLVERGIECAVVAPGLVPRRPGERVKTDSRDARKLARLFAGGLLEPIQVPSRELEAARDLVCAPRGRPPRSDARSPPAVQVLPAPRPALADERVDGDAAHVARRAALRVASAAADLRYLPACDRPRRRADRAARAGAARDGRAGPVARAGRQVALPARRRDADRARARRGDRRLQPLPH